jgi:2,3-bisphosphoglycerate-dependent phosphoglycerate mutase
MMWVYRPWTRCAAALNRSTMILMARDADLVVVFESHATSLDNEAGLASGWYDVALSATGEEQASLLGARRRDDDLAAVFCSDLTRSFRTAEIAFRDRVLPIVRDARLRECDYGAFTRRSALEIEERRVLYVATPFPNGESYEQVVARVSAWLTEAATTFAGRTVLVIGHRATFYALEHLFTHIPLREAVTSTWHWQPGWTYRSVRRDHASL